MNSFKPFSSGAAGVSDRRNWFSLFLISRYQRWISPFFPPVCRFEPTCSEYSRQCFARYRWWKAVYLTGHRILRCHPYCEGGFDPVQPTEPGQPIRECYCRVIYNYAIFPNHSCRCPEFGGAYCLLHLVCASCIEAPFFSTPTRGPSMEWPFRVGANQTGSTG